MLTVRALRISTAVMAALGTLLLGLGQQSVFLPVLAAVAAAASVVLTDELRVFRLNRNIANVAAIGAVCYALTEFFGHEADLKLLAIANLLIYLQIVLLFQSKNLRVYWQLCILSLLQVVVAAALNLNVIFGVLLLVYLVITLVAMTLLLIYRESSRFTQPSDTPAADRFEMSPANAARTHSDQAATWSTLVTESTPDTLLGKPFFQQIGMMTFVTLLVTVFAFFAIPRRDGNAWNSQGSKLRSETGFTQEVSLDTMGRILQSDELALRASFYRASGEPYRLKSEPYFRGTVLTHYNYRRGLWRNTSGDNLWRPVPEARQTPNTVLQEVVTEPSVSTTRGRSKLAILFSTAPVETVDNSPGGLRLEQFSQQLLISLDHMEEKGQRFKYVMATKAFRAGHQRQFLIDDEPEQRTTNDFLLDWPAHLTGLRQLAQQVVDDSGVDPDDKLAKARVLEAYFHQPGLFDYSLDPDVVRSKNRDPVEDFLLNHRTGHCEYFASALVLMLRTQGIPARMVVGFKGGEYNRMGNFYIVRQRNAHAWVEAYLAPGEFPASEAPGGDLTVGAWMRLDPTPADFTQEDDLSDSAWSEYLADGVDYVQFLWNEYVLGLNAERQWRAIYQPIRAWIIWFGRGLLRGDFRGWIIRIGTAILLLLTVMLLLRLARRSKKKWLSRYGEKATAAARKPLELLASLLRLGTGEPGTAARRPTVEFYERLESLMAGQGMHRGANQTQREFAVAAGGMLADSPALAPVSGLPRRIVELYYRVRFGGRTLDNSEIESVELALSRLEAAMNEPRV